MEGRVIGFDYQEYMGFFDFFFETKRQNYHQMKTIWLFILALFVSISAYAQPAQFKKSAGGKQNSVRSMHKKKGAGHVATEGDGTGDKILGEETKRLKNLYAKIIGKRKKFAARKYRLKSAGGEPIKPTR
jgi:hypothetical protein